MKKLILLICALQCTLLSQNIFETYYNAGMFYESGQYENAKPLVEECIKNFYTYEQNDYHPFVGALTLYGAINIGLGNIEKADSIFSLTGIYIIERSGPDSPETDAVYSQSAAYFRKFKCFAKSEKFYKKFIEIIEGRKNKEKDSLYAITLSDLGGLYLEWKKLNNAEKYFTKSAKIITNKWGDKSQIYGANLLNFAVVYDKRGELTKAINHCNNAVDIIINSLKTRYDVNSEEYMNEVSYLGDLLCSSGFFEQAEPLYYQSSEIIKKIYGENSEEYLHYMFAMGKVYINAGRNSKINGIGDEILRLIKEYHSSDMYSYVLYIHNLAELYNAAKYDEKNFGLISEVYNILNDGSLKNDSLFALATMNMGITYGNWYNISRAQEFLNRSINMWEILNDTANIVTNLNSLAILYGSIGDYDRSEELLIKGLGFADTNTNIYALLLNSLGILNAYKGDYGKSYKYFSELTELTGSIRGRNSVEYFRQVVNRVTAGFKLGDKQNSLNELIDAKEHLETFYGKSSPELIVLYDHLTVFYHDLGDYTNALMYADKALDILEQNKGMMILMHSTVSRLKARTFYSSGKMKEAENIYKSECVKLADYLIGYYPVLSENEKFSFKKSTTDQFDIFYSYALNMYNSDPGISSDIFNSDIKLKSNILTSSAGLRNIINNSEDEGIRVLFQKYLEKKKDLYKLISSSQMKKSRSDIEILNREIGEIEIEISKSSADFSSEIKQGNYTWKDIQQHLNDNEAVVDLMNFNYFYRKWTGEKYYTAMIIRKGMISPLMVTLCKSDELEKLIASQIDIKSGYVNDKNVNKLLSDKIWKPLEVHLKGVNKVYISPSGILNRVSYYSLTSGNDLLIDKYDIVYLRNPVDVINWQPLSSNLKNAVIFGGIDYDSTENKNAGNNKSGSFRGVDIIINDDENKSLSGNNAIFSGGKWNFLSGTLEEARSISGLMSKYSNSVKTITGAEASEELLKSLSGENSPSVLHIATHGFFFPPAGQQNYDELAGSSAFVFSSDPLLRAGLILSGANKYWSGQLKQTDSTDDGILTAYEVSNLNLKNTDLVVLSACETGIGDIRGGEGVYGLQSAFKIAGAKSMIISLWKVPDLETVELMGLFYKNWLEGKTNHDAFYIAQKEMRKKYEPYYWAAFILVE
jgi:CHAT domain-containing protein